jgi:DNA (cytosine-5)-methyltransferase 1
LKQKPHSKHKSVGRPKTVADFFAGIGLVSLGLEKAGWETVYALDYDKEKEAAYINHFGAGHYHMKDIATARGAEVPKVTLAHASFPCTDLSVAGARGGIHKGESSAFWEFARILREMQEKHGKESPPFVLLENVEGLLSSNSGGDLHLVLKSLNEMGYRVDLLRIDASHFVPQSRVRIFIVGVHDSIAEKLVSNELLQEHNLRSSDARHKKVISYVVQHPDIRWYFHDLPNLPKTEVHISSIIDPTAKWWPAERAAYLRSQIPPQHRPLVETALKSDKFQYFTSFRRMRVWGGKSQSTAELRSDGIAGCLRTPKGGSARQILVRIGKGKFEARLINGAEAGRLMGADEFKINPALSLNQVLFGFGDAVCVPALEWIGREYLNTLSEGL